ncbi:MAG: transglutaminase [Comamonadaceae bacterium CG1_02_60_18]|nr:MAG: transglutaminase [Comamonadaceae bacterium CG1_02_60_18]PIQ55860.1 MAG: transglutaminase [Comamonadaceae bacterium CG12_big_fil_rev_8_21_14_0_65_59_15]
MIANPLRHLPRDARDTLFMLAVIAWVLAPLLRELPLWCSALSALVMLWRATLAWHGQPLPGRWWKLGLLALAVAATLVTYKTLLGRDAGVTLVAVLLTLKTLELRARRDAFVVFFLSFFLLLTNFFYSQSLLTALAMLLALWGLLTALVNAHMPVGQPPLWQAARIAGGMTLLGAPIMVLLFVLFPRMAPLWGMPADAMAGRSGLSAQMTVGNIARLALDDSVAMRIAFDGTPPAQSELYFRGPVLSTLNGQRWEPAEGVALLRDQDAALQVRGPAVRYQVTLEPNQQPWLLTLDAAPQAPELPQGRARMTSELQWLQNANVTELMRYRVTSYPQFSHGTTLTPAQLRPYLTLPFGLNPRTEQLAQQLRAATPPGQNVTSYLMAQALQRLRSGGYVYTLEPGVYGRDSADEFWFDRKAGFCEHIASSFVILLRSAGVPARVVTGYQGGQLNSFDGFWTVRQSDAHAWAEVWLAGQGWLRVDPTAAVSPARVGSFSRLQAPRGVIAEALLGNVSPAVALNLRALWDAANNRWNQWVLNYTHAKQLNLLQNLGFDEPSWEDLVYLLCAIVVTASLAGAAWNAWERQQQDPWLQLLGRARQVLKHSGYTLPANSTPRQLTELLDGSARDTHPATQSQTAWRNWLLQLEALRYAAGAPDFRRQLATLRQALRQLPRPS